jgi:hypothetical protein
VVVDNRYRMQDIEDGSCNDGVECNKEEFMVEGEETQGNMDLDS